MNLMATLERLAKWRSVFAAWQLGTRSDTDAECKAVKDHREATIMLRAEVSALVTILVEKKVVTETEWAEALLKEAENLDEVFRKKFPGIEATDDGISYDLQKLRTAKTMEGWPA